MRLNCLVCGDVLLTKSRPPQMKHHDKVKRELVFNSYLHCKNCGCSIVAIINMKIIREAFEEPKD